MRHGEFLRPFLVRVYDAECPWSREDDYFRSVVNETPAARVLDLGCGTGRLALGLAAAGHTVTGVDPARASLDAARAKPGAERVTWIEGTSAVLASVLPDASFDVAVLTSHVAQFFVTDEEWARTLADLHRALVPGGRLAFDSRAWERWNPVDSLRRIQLPAPDGRVVTAWTEVTAVHDDTVSFTHHYEVPGGRPLTSTATLRFRPAAALRASLATAGFTLTHLHRDWSRTPTGSPDGELLPIARTWRSSIY